MDRPPRPVGAPVLSAADWVRLCVQGAVMTVGSLVAYQIGEAQGGAVVGATMLLTTLSLFHLAAGLLSREQRRTIFDRAAIPGPAQLHRYGFALAAIVAVTLFEPLQGIFKTTGLPFSLWATAVAIALSLVVVEELVKVVLRRHERRVPATRPGHYRPALPA